MKKSFFTISLDFELFWGVYDVKSIESYGSNILGGRKAIPLMLSLFKKYKIHATWATVGMVSFENKKELLNYVPDLKPDYENKRINPYQHLKDIGENEREDPYHFGYSLLNKIAEVDGMEIGSHSFSHFYCLEEHNEGAFLADLRASKDSFKRLDIEVNSLVLCRNQYKKSDLVVASDLGFKSFRGNEENYFYKPRKSNQPLIIRTTRLADAYLNITGHHSSIPNEQITGLINVPSSRFLRPVSSNKNLESLRLKRIKSSMLNAAIKGEGFHLWWHPHNFGKKLNENISFLTNILDYYKVLEDQYGMQSLNISEVASL